MGCWVRGEHMKGRIAALDAVERWVGGFLQLVRVGWGDDWAD